MRPEEIAWQAAEALVGVVGPAGTEYGVRVGPAGVAVTTWLTGGRGRAEAVMGGLTQALAAAVFAAIERALREVPVPQALDGATLDKIAGGNSVVTGFNLTSATGSNLAHKKDVPNYCTVLSMTATATLQLKVDCTGGNLSAATAGTVNVWVRTTVLP